MAAEDRLVPKAAGFAGIGLSRLLTWTFGQPGHGMNAKPVPQYELKESGKGRQWP
jgi:hypothetical protein